MPDISQIKLPSGNVYDIKDQGARDLIEALESSTSFLGVTTTAITEGSTTNPIMIGGKSTTAKIGNIVTYGSKEFVFNYDNKWQEFGDLSALGELAFKDSATGSYTPEGSISQPTFTGKSMTSTGTFTPEGTIAVGLTGETKAVRITSIVDGKYMAPTPRGTVSVSASGTTSAKYAVVPDGATSDVYTPTGTVSTPTITVTPNFIDVNSFTDAGELPSLTATVADEVLTLGFDRGRLPSGMDLTVVSSIKSATSTQPSFTGNGVELSTKKSISIPNKWDATFTGNSMTLETADKIQFLNGAEGTFTGKEGNVSVTGTTAGTVGVPTFTGTSKNVTVS